MKLFHISDLHIGKRLKEYSLLEDQRYILNEILKNIDRERPDGIIIAGDIYDKKNPSAEAIEIFDQFLYDLAARQLKVFIIYGNHDAPETIAFGSRLFREKGIHVSPVFNGRIEPVTISDEYGPCHVYLLPFVKPANLREYYPERQISTYNDAIKVIIEDLDINKNERNIIVTHQFLANAVLSESEDIFVGGIDMVEAGLFAEFDYVALGHLHRPQRVARDNIRYSGSPLAYSLSEADPLEKEKQGKSITLIDLQEKGKLQIDTIALKPLHRLSRLSGCFAQLSDPAFYENCPQRDDYLYISLSDEEAITDDYYKLKAIYPRMVERTYANELNTLINENELIAFNADDRSPLQLFSDFFQQQNGKEMNEKQKAYMSTLLDDITKGEQNETD